MLSNDHLFNDITMLTAKTFETKAKNKLSKMSFLSIFGCHDESKIEAAELYKKAAIKYFENFDLPNTTRCLNMSIDIYLKLKGYESNVVNNLKLLINYTKSLKPTDVDKLIEYHEKLANMYYLLDSPTDNSRYINEQYLEISNIYEKMGDLTKAFQQLNKCVANDNYEKVLQKKGELMGKLLKYKDASNFYQEAGENYCKKKNLSGQMYARDIFTMCIFYAIATKDMQFVNMKMNLINDIDSSFKQSIDGKKTINIVDALNKCDITAFELSCKSFDDYKKFTSEQLVLLLEGKKIIEGIPNDSMVIEHCDEIYDENDENMETDIC